MSIDGAMVRSAPDWDAPEPTRIRSGDPRIGPDGFRSFAVRGSGMNEDSPAAVDGGTLSFGRFQLQLRQRELVADGVPVHLGGRAFDLLLALVEARGALVTKDDALTRVWPGIVVEENNLQVQISALRKAFGADRGLISTVARRGYRFTGEIRTHAAGANGRAVLRMVAPAVLPPRTPTNLPEAVADLIGREVELEQVRDLVAAHRLTTLIGAGGIGKTRLGLEVARELLPTFADGVWVAELAALSDPDLVPVTVARACGLELPAGAVSAERVAQAIGAKRLLLVLDNCEHVIGAAANMAEALLRAAPGARVLVTSREPLRAEGECLYRVGPLELPAEGSQNTEELLRAAAVRLFVARARAADPHFAPDHRIARSVAAICRRLGGTPLAIELAAARAAALRVEGVEARLDDRFRLLTGGRRTALPRHQTLAATFDWSYELLPERERIVLRRLAVFAGSFSLEAASAVAAGGEITPPDVVDCVANLITKSLVTADASDASPGFRLVETTRAYALEKLAASGELEAVARRHAECCRAPSRAAPRPGPEQAGASTARAVADGPTRVSRRPI